MTKRLTTEQFIERAIGVHGNTYDYSEVEYIKGTEPVKIICRIHSKPFCQRPDGHLVGKGCPECGHINGTLLRSGSTKDFIKSAEEVHGDAFDYSEVAYKSVNNHVKIRCVRHDKWFEQFPKSHLKFNGCPDCKSEKISEINTLTTEEFIEKAIGRHGNRYDYSKVEYKGTWNKVEIICREHGSFWQVAKFHTGWLSGCPSCAKGGYSTLKQGTLYVLTSENTTKVGITNLTAKHRADYMNCTSQHNFTILREYSGLDGKVCNDIEDRILKILRAKYKNPREKFHGYTECFLDVDRVELLSILDEMCAKT